MGLIYENRGQYIQKFKLIFRSTKKTTRASLNHLGDLERDTEANTDGKADLRFFKLVVTDGVGRDLLL